MGDPDYRFWADDIPGAWWALFSVERALRAQRSFFGLIMNMGIRSCIASFLGGDFPAIQAPFSFFSDVELLRKSMRWNADSLRCSFAERKRAALGDLQTAFK